MADTLYHSNITWIYQVDKSKMTIVAENIVLMI
jgi:hypothetical protein